MPSLCPCVRRVIFFQTNSLYLCPTAVKKLFTIILALLYFVSTTGATVHLHYCMDELVGATLWKQDEQNCGQCGMSKADTEDNGCCKDEPKQVKVEKEHKLVATPFTEGLIIASVPFTGYTHLPFLALPSLTEENPRSNAPPRSSSTPIYTLIRVFRI